MKTLKLLSFAVCFTLISVSVYGMVGVPTPKGPPQNGPPAASCTQNVANNAWLKTNSNISLCELYEKVGIGGNPFYIVHIRGETFLSTSPNNTYIGINNSGTTAVGFDLNPSTGTKVIIAATGTDNTQGPGKLVFKSADSVDVMVMDLNTHNVGIGTINPGSKLTVVGADNDGTVATLKLVSPGSQVMLLDGNEIDANGTLFINVNSNNNIVFGGGNVGFGMSPIFKVDVAGTLRACTLRVNLTGGGCDYVFYDGYKKDELDYVRDFTEKYHHLPGVESAKDMIKDGLNVSNMFTTLLKKIEEIFLHLFDFDKALQGLNDGVDNLFENDKAIEKKIDKLEKENKALNHKVDILVERINALEQK